MALNIAIAGANGRMGRMLVEAVGKDPDSRLFSAFDVGSDVDTALNGAHVLIDFTRPAATLDYLPRCAALGVNIVVGTTGFTPAEVGKLEGYASRIAIVFAPNMSLGVNVTAKLVAMASSSLGMAADIEVFEAHHKLKVDAPSGTALMLGGVAARARGQSLDAVAVFDRHGDNASRKDGSIGFTSIRAGDIVGDHTVFFVLDGERIEITHKSSTRSTYAHGAIRAAKFLQGRPTGLFTMNDVLGLK